MATGCISGSSRIGTIPRVLALVPTAQLTPLINNKELLLQHLYLQYLPENITTLFMLQRFKHKLNVTINTLFIVVFTF